MGDKVIPNGRNYVSESQGRKVGGIPGKRKQSNIADLKRYPQESQGDELGEVNWNRRESTHSVQQAIRSH